MRALDPHAQQKPVLGAQLNWAHPLAQGLLHAWHLLEGGGAYAGNATATALPLTITSPSWGGSLDGTAMICAGSGSTGTGQTASTTLSGKITLEIRCYPSAFQASSPFISSLLGIEAASPSCLLRFGDSGLANNKAQFAIGGAKVNGVTACSANALAHIVGTYDGTTQALYLNGRLEASGAGTSISVTGAIGVGLSPLNSRPLNGTVVLARIWSRALAPDEVAQLYAEPFTMMQQPTYRRWFVPAGGGTTHLVTASVVQASAAGVTKIDVALRAAAQTSVATAQRTDALARAVQAASSSAVQRATAHLALLTQNSAPSVQRTDAAARGATTGGVAALSKTLVSRRGVVQASVAALGKSSNALRSTVQASVAALGKSSNALRSTVQASVAAVTFGAHTYTITAAVVTASVAALKNTTTARRGVAQASAAGAVRAVTAVRGAAQSSIAGTARAVTAVRGVAQTSIATLLGLPSGLIGAARAVYHLIARALSFALVARAYAFVLPAGEESMMAVPTDPTKAALIGKHEVQQVYSLDLTNGLNGELPASANPVQPMVLQVKHGQQTTDVSAQKLRSWSLSPTAPYVLTFVIGDGNQLPGYTYLAGAYVTTASGRVFEGYIAIPCVVEPGL